MKCFDLFAGVCCARKAWGYVESAAVEMWGFKPEICWTYSVACL